MPASHLQGSPRARCTPHGAPCEVSLKVIPHSHRILFRTLAVDSIPVWIASRGALYWKNGPKLNGTLGRDWPGGLGEEPEPEGTKDPSVQLHKIQIALSIYHSILAQVLRCARGPSEHATSSHPYPTCPEPPGGNESPSAAPAPHTRPLVRPRTLAQDPGPTLGPGTSRCWYHSPIHHIDVPGGENAP